jgi:glycosyltransferase involved in cell wall biosynthesis
MRVLIISQHYWPEAFRVNDLAAGLRERAHEVEVLSGMPNYPGGHYFEGYRPWGPLSQQREGIRIHRVPVIPRRRGGAIPLALNYASFALAGALRAPWLVSGRWDVAFVFQPSPVTAIFPALVMRMFGGPPVVAWVQDLWPESIATSGLSRSRVIMAIARRVSEFLYRSCDLLLAQSQGFVPRLIACGARQDKVDYLPNWAEDAYRSTATAASPGPAENWFTVLFAGNLGRFQGLNVILDAAERLRQDNTIRWIIVGDGPLRSWFEGEVARRGLVQNVQLVGRKPLCEMPALFSRAGALLVTLRADPLNALTIPSKVQSYLAAGVPVIAAIDGEGARVIDESRSGFAGPAGDGAALATNVLRMRDLKPEERHALGQAGRQYYLEQFDRKVCLDRIERIFDQLTKGGKLCEC